MKNNRQISDFKLLNTALRLRSNRPEFSDFAKSFTGLSIQEGEVTKPEIEVNLTFNESFRPDTGYKKVSRHIWLGNSGVFISEFEKCPGLSLKANEKKGKLYIDAFFTETKLNPLKKILFYPRSKGFKLYISIVLIYYLIYLPFIYYLERHRHLYLLHAAAFEYKRQGIILAGLGGVGKSTFSLAPLFLTDSKFLSDNLIFHDEGKIYALPEPIALNPENTDILGNIEQILQPKNIRSSHNRMFYRIKPELFCPETIPKYLFWLQWGTENKIRPIEPDVCRNHLLNINLLAKELRGYYVLAAAFDLARPGILPADAYYRNLGNLLSNLACFSLEFKPGVNLKTVFNETVAKVVL